MFYGYPPLPLPPVFWNQRLRREPYRQVFEFKGLAGKVFKNQRVNLSKSAENGFGAVSRFRQRARPSTALRVTPAKHHNLETTPIRSLSWRTTGLKSMDFDHGWI